MRDYTHENSSFITSEAHTNLIRFECEPASELPTLLQRKGHDVAPAGSAERLLPITKATADWRVHPKGRPLARRRLEARRKTQPLKPLKVAAVVPLNLSLAELAANGCRYPYGDSGDFTFCGHQRVEKCRIAPRIVPCAIGQHERRGEAVTRAVTGAIGEDTSKPSGDKLSACPGRI